MVVKSEPNFDEIVSDPTRMRLKCESEREIMVTEPEKAKNKEDREKQSLMVEDTILKEMLRVDTKYLPLLTLLERFSPGEDSIQMFNRKLYQFETTISFMCPDETLLCRAFATFRAAALSNSETARKLAVMGAFFTRHQRHPLRGALLDAVMQKTFSKLKPGVLERSNPTFLINAANLMGDYFARARLCNGKKAHYLASPLLQFMRALLDRDDIRAHHCLATQLIQNRRELLPVVAQELSELYTSIRSRLHSSPSIRNIWLFVAADLCEIAQKVSANLSQISRNNNKDTNLKQARQKKEKKEEIMCYETILPPNVQTVPVPSYPPPKYYNQRDWASQKSKTNVSKDEETKKYKDRSSANSNQTVLPPNVKRWPPLNWTPPPPRPVIPVETIMSQRQKTLHWNKYWDQVIADFESRRRSAV